MYHWGWGFDHHSDLWWWTCVPYKKKTTKKTRPPEEKAKGGGGREDMRQPGSISHFYRDEEKNFSLKKVRLLKVRSTQTIPVKSSEDIFSLTPLIFWGHWDDLMTGPYLEIWTGVQVNPTDWMLARMSHKVCLLHHNWVLKSLFRIWEEVESTWLAALFLPTPLWWANFHSKELVRKARGKEWFHKGVRWRRQWSTCFLCCSKRRNNSRWGMFCHRMYDRNH